MRLPLRWSPLALVFGTLAVPADAQWRVDQLGVLKPDPLARTTTSYEGGGPGRTFNSENRLAFITGETAQTTVTEPMHATVQWIYDAQRRKTFNLTAGLLQLVPDGRFPHISRVTSSGIAIGTVNLPEVNDVPQFLPWVFVDGKLSIAELPPPPPQVPSGGYSQAYHEDFSATTPILANAYFQDSQSRYVWRSSPVDSRLVGFYDAEHRGSYRGQESYSSTGTLVFDAPYREIALGWSNRAAGGTYLGQTAWIDDGTETKRIGFYDALHTNPQTGFKSAAVLRTTPNGWIVGASESFSGDATGQTLWKYHVAIGTTTRLGPADSLHTNPATGLTRTVLGSSGTLFGSGRTHADVNSFGEVIGYTESFGPQGELGRTAWLADRHGNTRPIGLTDPAHTLPSGLHFNTPVALNELGQAVGASTSGPAADTAGAAAARAVWFHSGTSSQRIGLFDAEHTRSTDGYQFSDFKQLDDAGRVWGGSLRLSPSGKYLGGSAWIFDGVDSRRVGLLDADHTDSTTGFQSSAVQHVNAAGQALGLSMASGLPYRHTTPRSTYNSTAWLLDPATGYHSLVFDTSGDGLQFYTNAQGLSEAGDVVGMYRRFNDDPSDVGQLRPFHWSIGQGLTDIGDILESTYPAITFDTMNLLDAESALACQFLIEASIRGTLPLRTEQALFLVTSVPEPSAATILLMMAVPVALGARTRRCGQA